MVKITETEIYAVEQLEKDEAELLRLRQALFNSRPMGREKRIFMQLNLRKVVKNGVVLKIKDQIFKMKSIKKKL